jgi:hypothetical protein
MFDTTKHKARTGKKTDPHLWNRIKIAPLPVSKARHEFAQALAYAIDLPVFEAREVVEEYRRFLYLATITEAPRVPPEAVRKAWMMHAQSPEYAAFCAEVLGKPLGFDDGTRKFGAHTAYRRTLDAYMREFAARPPAVIWPSAITLRMPRWLTAHAAVLGFTGMVAWDRGEPLLFATGVGISLALYGLDIYGAHMGRERRGLGADVTDDLAYFLSGNKGG